jgi:GAF domain-containing protein
LRAHDELESELNDTKLLQGLSAELINDADTSALYENIIDGAVKIMRSDFASMQLYYPERGEGGELRLLAFREFQPRAAKFWEWVRADSQCTCGVALRTGRRVIESNVKTSEFMAGTADQATYLQTGIGAVQSIPLVARDGKLLGMISTHWSRPYRPRERDLRLLDILARKAADVMERKGTLETHSIGSGHTICTLAVAHATPPDEGVRLIRFYPASSYSRPRRSQTCHTSRWQGSTPDMPGWTPVGAQ